MRVAKLCDYRGGVCRKCGHKGGGPGVYRVCVPLVAARPAKPMPKFRPIDYAPRRGLGDWVSLALSMLGITKTRASQAFSAFGVKDCGCAARQQAMNEWGKKNLGIG